MIHKITTVTEPFDAASPKLLVLSPGAKGKLTIPARLKATDRTIQHIAVEDIGALEAYLEKQVTEPKALAIFIDTVNRVVTAVLDYAQCHTAPGWNQHVITLKLEFSHEFAPLFAVLNKALSQDQFLNFLDEWGHLFQQCSQLKEVIADFRSHAITKVHKLVNQRTGAAKLIVTTEDATNEEVNLPPPEVTAVVAIFPDQPEVELPVLIRYRPNQGAVGFTLLVPGLQALIVKEIIKIESRIHTWCGLQDSKLPEKGWDTVLRVRAATPQLTKPEEAKVIDIEGHLLPADLSLTQKGAITIQEKEEEAA
jgi:hypothetical protein